MFIKNTTSKIFESRNFNFQFLEFENFQISNLNFQPCVLPCVVKQGVHLSPTLCFHPLYTYIHIYVMFIPNYHHSSTCKHQYLSLVTFPDKLLLTTPSCVALIHLSEMGYNNTEQARQNQKINKQIRRNKKENKRNIVTLIVGMKVEKKQRGEIELIGDKRE